MIEIFNIAEFLNKDSGHTVHTLQRRFLQKVAKHIYSNLETDLLITNPTTGALLSNIMGFHYSTEDSSIKNYNRTFFIDKMINDINKGYCIGSFIERDLLADPSMKNDDNRVILEKNNKILSEIILIDENGILI